jgi:hypothetical protein
VANGFFRKDEFRYDAAQDAYVCPGRHELKPIRQGRLRDMRKVDYANARACRDCPLRPRCTNNYRAVSRLENEDALDRMAARLGLVFWRFYFGAAVFLRRSVQWRRRDHSEAHAN